jgi:hypothetical protein
MEWSVSLENVTPGKSEAGQSTFLASVLLVSLAIGILGCPEAYSQVCEKTVSGTVKSSTGAPVANAQLLIKESTNGVTKSVTCR